MVQPAPPAIELANPPKGPEYWKYLPRVAYALSMLVLALGLVHVWRTMQEDDRVMRHTLLRQARILAAAIPPGDLKILQGTADDLAEPQYHRLKRQIEILHRTQPNLRYIYLVGHRNNGEIFFFLDNAPADTPDYVAPGTVYQDASPTFRLAVSTGKEITEGPLADQWGNWISAVTPIINHSTGRPIAALGIDVDASHWQRQLLHQATPRALAVFTIWLFALAAIAVIQRRYRLDPQAADQSPTLITALIAIFGIMFTAYACWHTYEKEKQEHANSFYRLAEAQTGVTARKFHAIATTELAGLAHFFTSRPDIRKDEFDRYIRYLIGKPPVSLWGWTEPVPATERDAFASHAQQRDIGTLTIWEPGPNREIRPAQGRDTFFPVLFYAPENGNERILGADLGCEAKRLRAITDAIHSRLPTTTGPVGLGFNDRSRGMIIFSPVFASDDPASFRGIAFATINFAQFVNREFRRSDMQHISLHTLNDDAFPELLCESGKDPDCPDHHAFTRPFFAFGQVFLLNSHPNLSFFQAHPFRRVRGTLLTGLALSLALAIICNLLLKRRAKLIADMHAHTSALSETKLLFNQLADQSRTVQWRCTPDGRFSEVNPVAQRVFGYSPDQLVGKMSIFDLNPEAGREAFTAFMQSVLQQREPFIDIIKSVQTADGSVIKVSSSGTPIINDDGQLTGIYGWDRDVTDREELAAKLLQSQRAAEAANQAKSRFITNMSHEIRTPINGVIGFSDLLRGTPLNNEQREYVDVIGSSSCQLLGLVNELLDYAQLDAGTIKIVNHDFNLRITVEDLCCQLAVNAHQKDLELLCVIPPQLPQLVHGDELHLQQAILCLLDNAIKFTTQGEVVLTVSIDQEDDKNAIVRFTVSDSGIGISPEHQKNIFDSFYQADESIKRRHGGAGLGLAIAKHLIGQMGGALTITSEIACGSVFSFAVPLTKQGCARPKFHPPPPELVHAQVLVIDDNAKVCEYLHTCLAFKELQTHGRSDLASAMSMLQEARESHRPYSVLFLDLAMPGVDDSCAAAFRQAAGDSTIFVGMLPLGKRSNNDAMLRKFFPNIITKPIRQKDLWHCLHSAVHNATHAHAAGQNQAPEGTDQGSEPAAPLWHETTDAAPPKADILLVEDHPVNQRVALLILEKAGYHADLANNGNEALRLLTQKSYQLVLMDVQMPEMDGLEATRRIRDANFPALNRDVPIIAITAHAIHGYRENCLAAGMNDFLTKPYTAGQLRKLVNHWLRK
ncbi:MAG: response regulator [Lentisphaerae bacterium]|nr:response regulator [Lentisphaerota bacterium]